MIIFCFFLTNDIFNAFDPMALCDLRSSTTVFLIILELYGSLLQTNPMTLESLRDHLRLTLWETGVRVEKPLGALQDGTHLFLDRSLLFVFQTCFDSSSSIRYTFLLHVMRVTKYLNFKMEKTAMFIASLKK